MDTHQDKSKEPKYFDVMPPGRSTPPSTSRPVIVGNHPEQEDPMISHQVEEDSQETETQVNTLSSENGNSESNKSESESIEHDQPEDSLNINVKDNNDEPIYTDNETSADIPIQVNDSNTTEDISISDEEPVTSSTETSSSESSATSQSQERSEVPESDNLGEEELLLPEHATPDKINSSDAVVVAHQASDQKSRRWPRILITILIFVVILAVAYYFLNR